MQCFSSAKPQVCNFKLVLENDGGMSKFPEFCMQNRIGSVN